MQSLVLAAVLSLAAARPQLPAGEHDHNDEIGLLGKTSLIECFLLSIAQITPIPLIGATWSSFIDDKNDQKMYKYKESEFDRPQTSSVQLAKG